MKKTIFLGLMLLNITITVHAQLTVSNPSPLCKGGTAILTAAGASNYSWSPATGLNTTTGATVKASPAVTTTYSVSSGSETKEVTVYVDTTCNVACVSTKEGGNLNWAGLAYYFTCDSTVKDMVKGVNLNNVESAPYVNGFINRGFDVSGGKYLVLPNNTFLPTGDFTISMWIKPTAATTNTPYLFYSHSAIALYITGAKLGFAFNGNGNNGVIGNLNLAVNTWYHILLVHKKDVVTAIYVNNIFQGHVIAPTIPYPAYGTTNLQTIGAHRTGNYSTNTSNYFNGIIDEVAFFNKALTAKEREQLYNAGAGRQAPY